MRIHLTAAIAALLVLCSQVAHAAPIDLILILDESGSVSPAEFAQQKSFAASLAQQFVYGPTEAAVGVQSFSTNARTIVNLSSNSQAVLSAINGMAAFGGATCMPCAFDAAASLFSSQGRGSGVPQVTVFITDGANNQRVQDFATSLAALHAAGPVFAIGVGDVLASEIEAIASDIAGIQTSFYANGFAELPNLLTSLSGYLNELTGQPPPPPRPAEPPPPPLPQEPAALYYGPLDIMILMDGSGSIDSTEWSLEKLFVNDFARSRLLGPGADAIGVASFAASARLLIPLQGNIAAVTSAVAAAAQPGGGTCIACALDLAAFQLTADGRDGVPKLTLVVTDGMDNHSSLQASIASLQAMSTVIAIGIGGTVSDVFLEQIASDVDGLQTVYRPSDFSQLAGLIESLTSSLGVRYLPSAAVPEPDSLALVGLLLLLAFCFSVNLRSWPGRCPFSTRPARFRSSGSARCGPRAAWS